MTPEQIELEFEHMQYDQALKKGEVFEDEEFEKYDEETEADDRLLSDLPTLGQDVEGQLPKSVEINNNPGEWVDVEIDAYEDD